MNALSGFNVHSSNMFVCVCVYIYMLKYGINSDKHSIVIQQIGFMHTIAS
jgi:hypothetical protein